MSTAAQLGNLLMTDADINYYIQQQIYWNNKYEGNAAKLAKLVKVEENWNKQYDSAGDASRSSALKMNGYVFLDKEVAGTDAQCEEWAYYKVAEYNKELLDELAELDIQYDSMKTMYDTLLEALRAEQQGNEQSTSAAAQDTGLLGGGG
ncbi:MAG: hypothetical protein MJ230_02910 [bacterium]|nr:hypothetical protein [bacterium]